MTIEESLNLLNKQTKTFKKISVSGDINLMIDQIYLDSLCLKSLFNEKEEKAFKLVKNFVISLRSLKYVYDSINDPNGTKYIKEFNNLISKNSLSIRDYKL